MKVTKQGIWHRYQGIYGLLGLDKINSVAFLEVKLLLEKHHKGWKIEYFRKVNGFLIQKRENICLVYSQRLHCWLFVESFLVCQPKSEGVKAAPRKNLLKSMSGKDMGILIYFPWIGKKYSHTLGNIWKLFSHIWEMCGFLNSIDFYSKPMIWKYISFLHNIPIVWNFTLPILCGFFGFRNNF